MSVESNIRLPDRDWTVLLLGGNSGAGKTFVARELGLRLGVAWLQVDDFRVVLERWSRAADYPELHLFDDHETLWTGKPEALVRSRAAMADVTSSAIEPLIASRVFTGAPAIIEGDDITPKLAAQDTYAGSDRIGRHIRSVFVIESDFEAIYAAMTGRGRGFDLRSEREQKVQVEVSKLYGVWLAGEARRLRQPVVNARPWDTLTARILEEIASR